MKSYIQFCMILVGILFLCQGCYEEQVLPATDSEANLISNSLIEDNKNQTPEFYLKIKKVDQKLEKKKSQPKKQESQAETCSGSSACDISQQKVEELAVLKKN